MLCKSLKHWPTCSIFLFQFWCFSKFIFLIRILYHKNVHLYNKQKQINNKLDYLNSGRGHYWQTVECSGANENLQILILGRVQKENAWNILKSSDIDTRSPAQGKRLKYYKIFSYWYSAERTRKTLEIFKKNLKYLRRKQ